MPKLKLKASKAGGKLHRQGSANHYNLLIKGDAHALRKAITATTKAMPVKSRTKVEVVGPTAAALLAEEAEAPTEEKSNEEPKKTRKPRSKKST